MPDSAVRCAVPCRMLDVGSAAQGSSRKWKRGNQEHFHSFGTNKEMSRRDYLRLCQMSSLSKTSKLTSGGSITTQQSELCFMEEAVLPALCLNTFMGCCTSVFCLLSFLNPCLLHTESGAAVVSVPNWGLNLL